jgi:tetratricopeptide (TPR) repeat protein
MVSFGQESQESRRVFDTWVRFYLEKKDYDRAITRASKILAGKEKVWSKDSPDLLLQIDDLRIAYQEAGKAKESDELSLRYNTISIRQELKRANDYLRYKYYLKSREISLSCLKLIRKDLGPDHPLQIDCLINIITTSEMLNDREMETNYLQEAFTVGERLYGTEDTNMAVLYNLKGAGAFNQGRFKDAIGPLEQSLGIRRKAGKENTFAYAFNLQVLGQAHGALGHYEDCVSNLSKSVQIFTAVLGPNHESTRDADRMLTSVLNYSGKQSSQAASEPPSKNPKINKMLELMKAGKFEDVLPDIKIFIKYFEENPTMGLDQQAEAQMRLIYALTLLRTNHKVEAANQLDLALGIEERIFGTTNPFANEFFDKVAAMRLALKDFSGADRLYDRCLISALQETDDTNPFIARLLVQKAQARIGLNDLDGGFLLYTRAVTAIYLAEDYMFPAMSEAKRLNVHSRNRHVTYGLLSLTLDRAPKHPQDVSAALQAWLDHKGAVLDVEGRIQGSVSASKNPEVNSKARELLDARMALARLVQSRPGGISAAAHKEEITRARDHKEAIEVDLSKISAAFALHEKSRRIDPPTLAKLLPPGSVYLDFARIPIFDFKKQAYADTRYLVFLVRAGSTAPPEIVDLGLAESIDQEVRAFQHALRQGSDGSNERERLYRLLITPLGSRLGSSNQLVLSPDGLLHLLPFEVLGLKGRKLLMDQHPISYLASGLDIARAEIKVTTNPKVMLVANPDFDLALKTSETVSISSVAGPG